MVANILPAARQDAINAFTMDKAIQLNRKKQKGRGNYSR
jgi:hypothetical protein